MPKKSTSLVGSGPEGNTNIFANGGQVRYHQDSRELHTTGVFLPPIVWEISKMRDVHGSPVYSISTSWSQEPVFFTNDNKSNVVLALEKQENFVAQEWHITPAGEPNEYYIWQYDRAQGGKVYLSAPNGLFSTIIYTPKPSTKFEIHVVSGAEEN